MPSNTDYIIGGFESAARGLDPYVKRQQDQLDRDEPLSDYEKARALILQNRLTPKEAAVRLKTGVGFADIQDDAQAAASAPKAAQMGIPAGRAFGGQDTAGGMGSSTPAPGGYVPPTINPSAREWNPMPASLDRENRAPEPAPQYGYAPGMGSKQSTPQVFEAEAYPPQRMKPYYPGAALDVKAPTIQDRGPQTRGELDTLIRTGGSNKDTPLDRMERLMVMEHGRNNRFDGGDETKRRGQDILGAGIAAKLTESARQADNTITYKYDSLAQLADMANDRISARLKEIDAKGGVDRQLEAMKMRVVTYNNKLKARSMLLNGLGTLMNNPQVKQAVGTMLEELETEGRDLWQDVQQVQGTGSFSGTSQGGPVSGRAAPVPGGAPKGPNVGGPALGGAAIQEPNPDVEPRMGTRADKVRTSSVSVSSKGPVRPTGNTKTDKNGVVWEEMSDGSARRK